MDQSIEIQAENGYAGVHESTNSRLRLYTLICRFWVLLYKNIQRDTANIYHMYTQYKSSKNVSKFPPLYYILRLTFIVSTCLYSS